MITRRRYMREITAARRTYREASEEAIARAAAKERRLDAILADVAHARADKWLQPAGGYYQPRIVIDITDPWVTRLGDGTAPELYERLARRIVESLLHLRKDHRPDMREADNPVQRLLRHG